ncbi:unnamed protein product [Rhizophagus irregularis]|nr:unnamed protein product [Rhizophagus irregularis]
MWLFLDETTRLTQLKNFEDLIRRETYFRKENAEIPELREKLLKFAEVEAEKVKLRRELEAKNDELYKTIADFSSKIGKLNAEIVELKKDKTAITKLESEHAEFRDRVTKVEQRQMHDDNSSNINSSNINSVADQGHDYQSSSKNSEKNGNSVTNRDDRQKNIPVITTSQENNDDDIEFTKSQVIEQELTKELLSGIISAPSISFEATERIPSVSHPSSSLDTTQNLVHLFQNAIRAGHEVILSWLYYSNSFENKVDEIRHDTGASDKTARSQIYKEMLEHLPGITLGNLRMRTLRAKKIRMLFGEGGVGIDKIKQVTFSVYDISSLTINQIQSVIKNVTSAGRTLEVPNRNHVTSVTNRDDQINVSAEPLNHNDEESIEDTSKDDLIIFLEI